MASVYVTRRSYTVGLTRGAVHHLRPHPLSPSPLCGEGELSLSPPSPDRERGTGGEDDEAERGRRGVRTHLSAPKRDPMLCFMNRYRLVALGAALLAVLPSGLLAQTFEGKLRMRTVSLALEEGDALPESLFDVAVAAVMQREGAEVNEGTMLIKGKVLRAEGGAEAGGAYSLWDIARDLVWVVEPAARAYMELPIDDAPAAAAPDPALKVRALGQTRTINGLRATGYEVRGEEFVIRAWMTQDHPGLTWAFRRIARREPGEDDPRDAAEALLSRYGFPVLLQVLSPGNLELEETVSVERATLDEALFRVPATFKKRAMPGGP
jgi:hypothetical protein